jgi:hypothetical protein
VGREAQVAFGWVENREWLVWGEEYLLLNLVKEVCDEKAAAEKARMVGEAMEVKKWREEEAVWEHEEREAAASARKLGFEEQHRALHATFKAKEIVAAGFREAAVALECDKKGIEESAAESV